MYRHAIRGIVLGAMLLGLIGCGGDSGTTGGGDGSKNSGRVYIRNESTLVVDVSYVDADGNKIETTIEPGDTEEATRGVLDGGTKIVLNVNPQRNCRSDVEQEVTVDGNTTVRVIRVGACGTKFVEMVIT